jgi:hypothetical protein
MARSPKGAIPSPPKRTIPQGQIAAGRAKLSAMPSHPPTPATDPETLALLALTHIAADEILFVRFLALSGLDEASLRARASEPAVLGGVLDFVLGDERLVVQLAAAFDVPPDSFARARRRLPGVMPDS